MLPEPVDLVFMLDTFHHIAEPGKYLIALKHYLKPGGRIAIIDFRENSPCIDAFIDQSMWHSAADLVNWMAAASYELDQSFDFLDDNYFVIYQCGSCGAADVSE